ncbi:ABC transporter permease [Lactiplantibacillus carotarum]|uniref:ABC transporter permease n=1 Tax=Lactiplantibacillus carotarum TaxID=2993456 RepID=UPI00298EF892|nr:ABC transporter permease [Lactiplantibacillus carotarum]
MRTAQLFKRSGQLIRFNLQRDWLKLTIWIVASVAMFTAIGAKFQGIYSTQAAIDAIVKTLKTPAMVSLFGAFTANPPYTIAKLFATEMVVFMAILLVIMNIMMAVAMTRGEEDSGLLELVRAHQVGRLAPLVAAVVELTLLNALIGVLFACGLQVAQMPGATATGNWLIGSGLAALGWCFGMLTLLLAQLANNASQTTMLSYAVFGVMYVARMGTDVSDPRLTWWIPFGWIEKLSAYQDNHWLPVGALILLGVVCGGVATQLNLHRDVGAGWLPTRPGRATASAYLRGPLGLLWRQLRVTLFAWIVGNFVLGAAYGSIFNNIGDVAKTNPTIKQLLGTHALAEANRMIVKIFIAVLAIVIVVVAVIPAVQVMLKLVSDENKGYLHQVVATAVSRWQLWASFTAWAVVSGSLVLVAGLAGMYLTGLVTMNDPIKWLTYQHVLTAYLPTMLVTIGTASLLVGWGPKWRNLIWLWIGYGFFAVYLGALIDLPKWAKQLSPFGFVNQVPIKAVDWGTSGWMLVITVVLLVLASVGYRHRDLAQ